ncbi:MAG: Bacterial Ig-like domain (group 2) [Pelotomaculum sp. PtaU1.Bin035]|nr:MAG: Bacterial Ig-like domain (group 2) [Pelotomaculum sp. PtaU1.Bin035]
MFKKSSAILVLILLITIFSINMAHAEMSGPELISPTGYDHNVTDINVSWKSVAGASSYRVCLTDITNNTLLLIDERNISTTSYIIRSNNFTAGHRYKLSVAAVSGSDIQWTEMYLGIGSQSSTEAKDIVNDSFNSDTGLWTYAGSARRDSVNGYVVLTENVSGQSGQLILNNPVAEPYIAEFRYKAGGGTGADDILFKFCEEYLLEFDEYHNYFDPTPSNHIAIKNNIPGDAEHLEFVDDNRVGDNEWHDIKVVVEKTVQVFIDGSMVLSWDSPVDLTYSKVEFSGSAGYYNNWHIIDDVKISPVDTETEDIADDDFDSDTGQWTYTGSAYRDTVNNYVVLTENVNYIKGELVLKKQINAPYTAEFRYKAGGGSGADGISFKFCEEYSLEFDNYYNEYDPTPSNHIAIINNSDSSGHLFFVNDERTEDNKWHDVKVIVGNTVLIYIDGNMLFAWNSPADVTYDEVKFTGSTGYFNNWHIVDDIKILPVKNVAVTGVILNCDNLKLYEGGAGATLKATITPADATNQAITWSSDNDKIVTVDNNGTVKPVKAGTAIISVTTEDGSNTAICSVTVNKNIGVKSIKSSFTSVTLSSKPPKNTKQLKITATLKNGKQLNITAANTGTLYSSDNQMVLVSQDGKITVSEGTPKGTRAIVTVINNGKSCKITIKVK